MQKIQNSPPTIQSRLLKKTFLSSSTNPPTLQICLQWIQIVSFFALILEQALIDQTNKQKFNVQPLWIDESRSRKLVLVSVIFTLLFRVYSGATLIRGAYIILLHVLINRDIVKPLGLVSLGLLGLNVLIDVLGHIEMQFNTQNVHSSTKNYHKLLHYPIIITIVVLHRLSAGSISNLQYITPIISIVLVLIAINLIGPQKYTSKFIKKSFLIFYVLSGAFFILELIQIWVGSIAGWIRVAVAIMVLLLLEIIIRKGLKTKVNSELSNGVIVNVLFQILVYLFQPNYDSDMEEFLKDFLDERRRQPQHTSTVIKASVLKKSVLNSSGFKQSGFKQSGLRQRELVEFENLNKVSASVLKFRQNIQNQEAVRSSAKKGLYQLLSQGNQIKYEIGYQVESIMLGDSSKTMQKGRISMRQKLSRRIDHEFRALMILAQVRFWIFNDLIGAQLILDELWLDSNAFSWIEKLCIYKFRQKLIARTNVEYKLSQSPTYAPFFINENLRFMLIKSSHEHLGLWSYIGTPRLSLSYEQLQNLLSKALQHNKQIDEYYCSYNRIWCQSMIIMHVDYLHMVRRDVLGAKAQFRMFEIQIQQHFSVRASDRVYLCLILDEQGIRGKLKIQNIGLNVKKLLGYSRSSLKSSKISNLLPKFFIQSHQKLIQSYFENPQLNSIYGLSKSVLIKHADGYYIPVLLELKLVVDWQGVLKMEGFIQLEDQNQSGFTTNWTNYFFVRQQDDQIVEVGTNLRDIIEIKPHNFICAADYFHDAPKAMTTLHPIYPQNLDYQQGQFGFKYLYHNEIEYAYQFKHCLQDKKSKYLFYCLCDLTQSRHELSETSKMMQNQNQLFDLLKYQKYPTKYEDFETNLQQFFQEKLKIESLLKRKWNIALFAIMIVILICGFSIKVGMVAQSQRVSEMNNQLRQGTLQIISYYGQMSEIGMYIQIQRLKRLKQAQYKNNHNSIADICLRLQQRIYFILDYDTSVTSSIQGPPTNRSLVSLTQELISNVYQTLYIQDVDLTEHSFSKCDIIFNMIWQLTLTNPLKSYITYTTNVVQFDSRNKMATQVTVCVLLLVVYGLMLLFDQWNRGYQYDTLKSIANINASAMFCNGITQYIRRVAGGIIDTQMDDLKGQSSADKKKVNIKGSSLQVTIQNASARQDSVRNLYGSTNQFSASPSVYEQSIVQSSNRDQRQLYPQPNSLPFNTLEIKERRQSDQSDKKQLKMKARSKILFGLWTVAILLTVGIFIGYLLVQNINTQVSLGKGTKKLLQLLQKKIQVSSTILGYLYAISSSPNGDTSIFTIHFNQYYQVENRQLLFDQVKYTEFSNFSRIYQQVNYVYLCDYMDCEKDYVKEINIIYNSAVHRFMTYMTDNIGKNTNSTLDSDIQLLIYAHFLLDQAIDRLLRTYLVDYQNNEVKSQRIDIIFDIGELLSIGLCLILVVIYYVRVFRVKNRKYGDMLNFVKKLSYAIDEEP